MGLRLGHLMNRQPDWRRPCYTQLKKELCVLGAEGRISNFSQPESLMWGRRISTTDAFSLPVSNKVRREAEKLYIRSQPRDTGSLKGCNLTIGL